MFQVDEISKISTKLNFSEGSKAKSPSKVGVFPQLTFLLLITILLITI